MPPSDASAAENWTSKEPFVLEVFVQFDSLSSFELNSITGFLFETPDLSTAVLRTMDYHYRGVEKAEVRAEDRNVFPRWFFSSQPEGEPVMRPGGSRCADDVDGLVAVVGIHLPHDAAEMVLDGELRQVQAGRYLLVGQEFPGLAGHT